MSTSDGNSDGDVDAAACAASVLEAARNGDATEKVAEMFSSPNYEEAVTELLASLAGDSPPMDDALHTALLGNLSRIYQDDERAKSARRLLAMIFENAVTRLRSGGHDDADAGDRETRDIAWCERVLELAFQDSKPSSEPSTSQWILRISQLLLDLHRVRIVGGEDAPDFRLLTLVWKNLTKLSKQYTPAFDDAELREPDFSASIMLVELRKYIDAQVERTLADVMAETLNAADVAGDVTLLRFLFRPFQAQFPRFANNLESAEVESHAGCVLRLLSVLLFIVSEQHLPLKTKGEVDRLISDVLAFARWCGDASNELNELTGSLLRNFLEKPKLDGMPSQAREQWADVDAALRSSHLLAFVSVVGDRITAKSSSDDQSRDREVIDALTTAFRLYRECASYGTTLVLDGMYQLVIELLLDLLALVQHSTAMQQFLLEAALHPHPAQRVLCWELWAEILRCHDSAYGREWLTTLTDLATADGSSVSGHARSQLLELLVAVYVRADHTHQRLFLERLTPVVESICTAGPRHRVTPAMEFECALFEALVAAGMLQHYDHSDKEDWIGCYLPRCFQLMGELLEGMAATPSPPPADLPGCIRVLDVCALVVKAVHDDNQSRESDLDEITSVLFPMCCEMLSQVAKQFRHLRDARHPRTPRSSPETLRRVLRTTLGLLTRTHKLLKNNTSNQCAAAMKDLASILETTSASPAVAVDAAIFVRDALGDMQVADIDKAVVRRLFALIFQHVLRDVDMQTWTPQASMGFDALLQLLANSNVFDVDKQSVRDVLDPAAHAACQKFFLSIMRGPASNTQPTKHRERACGITRRFDDLHTSQTSVLPNQTAISHDSNQTESAPKRQRLEHLTALCSAWTARWPRMSSAPQTMVDMTQVDVATSALEALLPASLK